jgi:hypothetical protein
MGDDLNDLPALRAAGVALAPANAATDVRDAAHVVTPRAGGDGAVRDAIEAILRARGDWAFALDAYLLSLSTTNTSRPDSSRTVEEKTSAFLSAGPMLPGVPVSRQTLGLG